MLDKKSLSLHKYIGLTIKASKTNKEKKPKILLNKSVDIQEMTIKLRGKLSSSLTADEFTSTIK